MKIDLNKLMETTPQELAKVQHDALKQHVLAVLDNIRSLIQKENYTFILDENREVILYSPSGDGYGQHNHFINFGYQKDNPLDIKEVVSQLNSLKTQIENS